MQVGLCHSRRVMIFALDFLTGKKSLGQQPTDHRGHGGACFAAVVGHAAGNVADGDRLMVLHDLQYLEFSLTEFGWDAGHRSFSFERFQSLVNPATVYVCRQIVAESTNVVKSSCLVRPVE